MKKTILVLVLFTLLVSLSANVAMAGFGLEDPALCVAGQWLTVNAAAEQGVVVVLPRGVTFGAAGNCPPPPAGVVIFSDKVVRQLGSTEKMRIMIDGRQASTPTVQVSYGSDSLTKKNNGRQTLVFQFDLR